jgi:hypothetical protein
MPHKNVGLNGSHPIESAENIVAFGVDAERASAYGASGDFWAVKDHQVAKYYSMLPGQSGSSVILGFDIPEKSIMHCLEQVPTWAKEHYVDGFYEFFPPAHAVLNSEMMNITITIIG